MLGLFFFYHCFVLPDTNAVSAHNFFNLPVATKWRNVDSHCSGVTALLLLPVGVLVGFIRPQRLQREMEALLVYSQQATIFCHVVALKIILEKINPLFTPSKPHIIIV